MAAFVAIAKPLIDSVTGIIEQFHASPEDKAKAQQQVIDAAAAAQKAAQDYDVQLNSIAGQNIRAEETNGDRFAGRARPSVIWMGNLLILWNWCLVPTFGAHWHLGPVTIPDAFWWTWGTVVTGYVFSRGMEKIATIPGDSQINLGGILKIAQKG